MKSTAASLALSIALGAASPVLAADTLALGAGTACRMMPERETKAMLGLKKRHVLSCANPDGTVTRVVFTRKGTVDCTDTVHIDAGGASTVVGETCSPKSQTAGPLVPDVFNLSGAWISYLSAFGATCDTQIAQNGAEIAVDATCNVTAVGVPSGTYLVSGRGGIVFEGHAFDIHAATTAPVVGNCEGRMTGQVSPDGQSMSGTVSCGGFEFGYTAGRQ